jgi:formate/nitrite transporter
MSADHSPDAYAPAEIARRIEASGINKAQLELLPLFTLGVLAGAFIAFGAAFYTLTVTGADAGLGPTRMLGGVAFSLGLILVVVGGAELFTGNALIVMAVADGKVGVPALLRNWGVAYVGNLVGAVATAVMVWQSGILAMGGDAVAATAVKIAEAKVALPAGEALVRGILCNVLVCLAVWLTFAAHTVAGKILAIIFPIAAFVALGFEHSIANMYFLPLGLLAGAKITVAGMIANLVPVTIGNIVGGGVLVGLVYWIVYVRGNGPGV